MWHVRCAHLPIENVFWLQGTWSTWHQPYEMLYGKVPNYKHLRVSMLCTQREIIIYAAGDACLWSREERVEIVWLGYKWVFCITWCGVQRGRVPICGHSWGMKMRSDEVITGGSNGHIVPVPIAQEQEELNHEQNGEGEHSGDASSEGTSDREWKLRKFGSLWARFRVIIFAHNWIITLVIYR